MTKLVPILLCLAQNPDPSTWTRPFVPFYSDLFAQERIYSASGIFVGSNEVTLDAFNTVFGLDSIIHEADSYHIHDVSELITGVTNVYYLTDDRGPDWWLAGANTFSASLTYTAKSLEKVQVNGYSWPLVADGAHIAYEYDDEDSTAIAGFTLARTTAMSALADRNCRVEWFYLSSDFVPDADIANGLWLLGGEPVGAKLNGIEQFGGI